MIVVFGAGGFIGTYLVDALIDEGFDVIAVDVDQLAEAYYTNRGVTFKIVDITQEDGFSSLPTDEVDAVVNLACLQPVNVSDEKYKSSDYIKVNVIGTINIMDYCLKTSAERFVYTISHRGVQGLWSRGATIDENSEKAVKYTGEYSMFSISECAAHDCVKHYRQAFGLKGVVFRLPPVYGFGPHLEGFRDGKPTKSGFLTFIEKAKAGLPIELWGDSNRARDIVYVKDVVTAIILALRAKEVSDLYNIASGKKISMKQEAEEIIDVFSPPEKRSRLIYKPNMPNSIEPFQYDITKARRDLQWLPRFGTREMLEDIKKEMESSRFDFLIEKRKKMFLENSID